MVEWCSLIFVVIGCVEILVVLRSCCITKFSSILYLSAEIIANIVIYRVVVGS